MALREPFNAISHMVGGGLSIAATPVLIARADGPSALVMVALYALGLIALYTFSTLFHAVPASRRGELWLERLDHVGIYLLIAGTYSPVAVLFVGGTLGWVLFILSWALAAGGIMATLTWPLGPKWVHIVGYITHGWIAVIAVPVLLDLLDGLGWLLILGGGIVYSGGAFLYVRDRPRFIGPLGDHEVWHVCVLVASAAHFAFVVLYVV